MLEDLLKGQEESSRVLIKDSADSPGRTLLLNWLVNLLARYERVMLICSERPPNFFLTWLPSELRHRLTCVCGQTDLPDSHPCAVILNRVEETASKLRSGGRVGVVFDSLTFLCLSDGVPTTCSLLHRISSDEAVGQVVAVLHTDVLDTQSTRLVEHICPMCVTLRAVVGSRHIFSLRHCRASGKVLKTEEYFTVTDTFTISKFGRHEDETKSKPAAPAHISGDENLPDLPFNLSLTDKERSDRSQVKLPYVRYDEESPPTSTSPASRIHYQADDGDDFDEEDPDDDLNI